MKRYNLCHYRLNSYVYTYANGNVFTEVSGTAAEQERRASRHNRLAGVPGQRLGAARRPEACPWRLPDSGVVCRGTRYVSRRGHLLASWYLATGKVRDTTQRLDRWRRTTSVVLAFPDRNRSAPRIPWQACLLSIMKIQYILALSLRNLPSPFLG